MLDCTYWVISENMYIIISVSNALFVKLRWWLACNINLHTYKVLTYHHVIYFKRCLSPSEVWYLNHIQYFQGFRSIMFKICFEICHEGRLGSQMWEVLMGYGAEPELLVLLNLLPILPPTHFTNVTNVKRFSVMRMVWISPSTHFSSVTNAKRFLCSFEFG